jgi:hypothetical protein
MRRWPGIIASIRTLIASYNDGAGRELLTAMEQPHPDHPVLIVESTGCARGAVTIAVDGADLCVRASAASHRAGDRHDIQRRIDCSRTDAATAAYLLQDWMERL